MSETVLILDLGTTRLKATLFDLQGAVLSHAAASYPTASPRPAWAEQDPRDWWAATVNAVRQAMSRTASGGHRVAALGITGQMHGLVVLDRVGGTLGPCLTVQDRRAAAEVASLEADLGGQRIYGLTGARLDAASPAAKIRWLAAHRPELLDEAVLFLPPKDYLRLRLTGSVGTEPVDAAGMLLYDLERQSWSEELAAACGVSIHALPPIQPGHSIAGVLTREAAGALGLPAGLPVATGAGDDVECLGAGLLAPRRAVEHLGTTGSILACSPRIVLDPRMRVDCYPHAVPGLYLIGGSTSAAGSALSWAADQLAPPAAGSPEGVALLHLGDQTGLDERAMIVFLPALAGERCPTWDPQLRGLLAGMTLSTTRQQVAQAVFAGVAASLCHILDTVRDLGIGIDELVTSGDDGGKSGAAWPILRATLYDRPLLLPARADPTALGTLMLALVAIGAAPDLQSAAELVPAPVGRIDPDPAERAYLRRYYSLYRALVEATAPIFGDWPS